MPRLIVVFDTNIYRQLSQDDAHKLVEKQLRCGIIACANFWSIMELGAHLCDPADEHLRICHRGLQALWIHCTDFDGSQPRLRVAGDSDAQLVLTLFNTHLRHREAETSLHAFIVEALSKSPVGVVPPEVLELVCALRDHRDKVEGEFTSDMQGVVRHMDSAATGWQPWENDPVARKAALSDKERIKTLVASATALVERAGNNIGRQVHDEELTSRVRYLLEHFRTPLHFYAGLLRKTIESGIPYSASKHANSIWDMQLCFYALPGAVVGGTPIVLVTNENAIHAAAAAGGDPERVMTHSEFKQRLVECDFDAIANSTAG